MKFSQNCLCIVPLLPVSSLALESISLQKTLLCSEINDILSQNFNRTQIFQVYLERAKYPKLNKFELNLVWKASSL